MPTYLGRCKDCDFAVFMDNPEVAQAVTHPKEVREPGRVYRLDDGAYVARCANRHRFFVLRAIKGKYSADHKCDARCLNAKGNDCTCSCGGANHGRGYAVQTVVAQAAPAAVSGPPATAPQIGYLKALLVRTAAPEATKQQIEAALAAGLTKRKASELIDTLLRADV